MKNFLLDTCIIIDYLKGKKEALHFIETLDQVSISVLTISELYAGVKGEKERQALSSFISCVQVIPLSNTMAELGGELKQQYFPSHGTGLMDALLAASAQKTNLVFITKNKKHFPMLPDLVVPY